MTTDHEENQRLSQLVRKFGKFKCPHCGLEQLLVPSPNLTPASTPQHIALLEEVVRRETLLFAATEADKFGADGLGAHLRELAK